MGLRLTTKVTVSGWRFLLRRVEHALVRRDTRMFDDPLQFYSRSVAVGIVIAVLIVVGAGLLAFFKPQGKLGGGTLFADRSTNQLYVLLSGRLHPVYNLSSARLILGSAAQPAAVSSDELQGLARGQYVGIPGAPYATPVSSDTSSDWALCDTVTQTGSVAPTIDTAVLAMPLSTDTAIGPIAADAALLAEFQGQEWIVTAEGRHAVDRTDRALTSAVGIPANAVPAPLSEGLFNALPDIGSWRLPSVPGAGEPNAVGLPDELVIGSVFQTENTSGPQYFVVLPDGVAQVGNPTAAALRATQSYGLVAPPPLPTSLVLSIPERAYPSPLPDTALQILSRQDNPALCWTWQRSTGDQAPDTAVVVGRRLPIPAAAMSTGIQQIQGTATVFIDGGKYVQLQSPDPRYGESRYYIDPQGVRFGVPDNETAGILGLPAPKAAPWEIIRILVDGPVLSREAALLEHDTLPADPSPRNVAPGAGQ